MLSTVKYFRLAIVATVLAVAVAWVWRGPSAAGQVAILIPLEFTLSFDNAVVNAKWLVRMSPFWQKMFLTVGMLIAVAFMRLLFPVLTIVATAHLSPTETWNLALHHQHEYASRLEAAHPAIVALSAAFLLQIFLDWSFSKRDIDWLRPLENAMRRVASEGSEDVTSLAITIAAIWIVAEFFSGGHVTQMLVFGVFGAILYRAVVILGNYTENKADEKGASDEEAKVLRKGSGKYVTGMAAFMMFLQLEFIDASFSFDGVSGAFAITSDPFLIAMGLGVGALIIRKLTVKLVKEGTLGEYVYLEHGAHWAIGALAILLLVTVKHAAPEYVTGGIGLVLIIAAYVMSVSYKKAHPDEVEAEAEAVDQEIEAVQLP